MSLTSMFLPLTLQTHLTSHHSKFGASLSYASCDAKTGAASPQILANSMLDDKVEVIIFSDKKCKDDCGYIRPGTVAYRMLH